MMMMNDDTKPLVIVKSEGISDFIRRDFSGGLITSNST